jgi:phosphoglycolate phosphatase
MVADDYEFWLFDLDGTLVDVDFDYAREVVTAVSDRLDIEEGFTDQEVRLLWYGLDGARERHLRRKGVEPTEFWETFHRVEDPVARAEATYLHGDAAFVGGLDQPVGLVTHCQRYLTEPVLDHVGIRDWFDGVVCCTEDLGWKPDPSPVEAAMSEIGVLEGRRVATDGGSTFDGVLAGDSPADVGAAWNAGLDGIHVERHGHDVRGQCVLGDYRVSSFEELF